MNPQEFTFAFVRFAFTLAGASVAIGIATGVVLVGLTAALQMAAAM